MRPFLSFLIDPAGMHFFEFLTPCWQQVRRLSAREVSAGGPMVRPIDGSSYGGMMTTNQIRHELARWHSDDGDLPVAALGSPDGELIVAPDFQAEMITLQRSARQAGQGFFCPPSLGGCGERLNVVAGPVRRPYFRHSRGSACGGVAEGRDIFTHRQIQHELIRWLAGLGFRAEAEHYFRGDRRSRVDVYVGGGLDRVVEVQLSNETAASKLDRTERYGGNVTWLFGPAGPLASRDHEESWASTGWSS